MNRILLEVIGVSYCNSQSGAYALLMGENGADRYIPIIIGGTEAQSIAMIMEKVRYTRPLTHDLFKNIIDSYSIKITEVVINKFKDGIFFSEVHCEHNGEKSVFDARPSDAIAMALRYNSPIYTYSYIIDEAGISNKGIDIERSYVDRSSNEEPSFLSIEDLQELLQDAVNNEDYQSAAKYRDLINERKKSNQS